MVNIITLELGQQGVTNPTMDVDLKFPTDVINTVPNTCTKIFQKAQKSSKNQLLDLYALNDQLKFNMNKFYIGLKGSGVDQTADEKKLNGYNTLAAYLSEVENSQLPIQRLVVNCLSEYVIPDPKLLKNAEDNYETSKLRYETISPEHPRVSYYEGWFPITRPMKESSLFIIFAFGIFMIICSLLLFIQMQGVELKVLMPYISIGSMPTQSYTKYIIGGVVVGGIIVAIGVWRKWF